MPDLSHEDCAITVQMENNIWIKSGADCNEATVDYVVCEQMATDGMLSEHNFDRYKNYFNSCNMCFKSYVELVNPLSIIPVRLTPNNLSSSVLSFHTFLKYGNLVNVACAVPRIVASRTFLARSSEVSLSRTTTSVRLQN